MWIWIIATLLAYFVKGLCGFANTLVFTSVMGFWTSNVIISPIDLVLGFPSNIILTWKNRKSLDPKVFIPLSTLVLIGNIPGAFLLKNVNTQYIKIVCGVVIILVGVEMLFRDKSKSNLHQSKIVLGIIGLISGVLCGLFGIGALLAAYIGRTTDTNNGFKANICAVFIVENIFRIILYSATGVLTLYSLKQAAILLPLMGLGLFAGMKSGQILDEKVVKKLVVVLLIISGVMLIIKSL